jgi:O-antigen/teichoic acid export membrane protein
MVASPALFALIFGPEWRQAGVLAAIMAPAAVINLAVAPVARIFALTSRPQLRFWFSVANLGGTLIALGAVKVLALDLVGATVALSIASFLAYVIYFVAGYVASASLLSTPPEVGV